MLEYFTQKITIGNSVHIVLSISSTFDDCSQERTSLSILTLTSLCFCSDIIDFGKAHEVIRIFEHKFRSQLAVLGNSNHAFTLVCPSIKRIVGSCIIFTWREWEIATITTRDNDTAIISITRQYNITAFAAITTRNHDITAFTWIRNYYIPTLSRIWNNDITTCFIIRNQIISHLFKE